MSAAKSIANAIVESVKNQPLRCWDGEIDEQFVLSELAARAERLGRTDAKARIHHGCLEVVAKSGSCKIGFWLLYQLSTRQELRGSIGVLVNSEDDLDVIHSFA